MRKSGFSFSYRFLVFLPISRFNGLSGYINALHIERYYVVYWREAVGDGCGGMPQYINQLNKFYNDSQSHYFIHIIKTFIINLSKNEKNYKNLYNIFIIF